MSDLVDNLTNAQVHLSEALRLAEQLEDTDPVPPPVTGPRKLASGVTHEYSTMWPGSSNHLAFLFQYPGGAIGLHDAAGVLYKWPSTASGMLPAAITTSSQPRWSRQKPTVFRYIANYNELCEFDVANGQSTTLRKFKDLGNINGRGESDTSEDDDHIVLCDGQYVFVYQLSTDKIVQEYIAPSAFNNLYLSSQNEIIIGYNRDTERGHVLHRRFGKEMPVTTKETPHCDTSSDEHGNPVIVFANGVGSTFQVTKTNLHTGQRTNLIELDWSLAIHVSLPDRAKFAIVTTYDPKNPNSEKIFANQILKVALDGGAHTLGKHGSNVSAGKTDAERYKLQPKASVSPDSSRYIFDSNGAVFMGTIS